MHNPRKVKKYAGWGLPGLSLLIGLQIVQTDAGWVEHFYSRGFYAYFSHLPKMLFAWIPFSVGDLFYIVLLFSVFWIVFLLGKLVWLRKWKHFGIRMIQLIAISLIIYSYFYVSWGLNYYREPIAKQLHLDTDTLTLEQHLTVLDHFIETANRIRPSLQLDTLDRKQMANELTLLMKNDLTFAEILSKTNLKVKAPLSSSFTSSLTVTGYFNPFTHEVHVNQEIPIVTYPFTVLHELAHQMGVGFEDECNFIAFVKLKSHSNPTYQYAALYEAINYLMRPFYFINKELYQQYQKKLSPLIQQDIREEKLFWQERSGRLNAVSTYFYDHYLKHNNQPEGMARYSLMSRLVIAHELKNKQNGIK